MSASTFDPARKHRFYFRCSRDGSKTLSFVDGNGNAKDMSDYEFVWQLKQKPQHEDNVIELTNSDLIRPSVSQVKIPLTVALTNIPPFENYYHQLNVTLPDGSEKTWITGIGTAHNGEFDGVNDEAELTINEAGETIQIVITDTAANFLSVGTYSTSLIFGQDEDVYYNATGTSPVFTLAASGHINGVGKFLRLNKPNGVTFPANFEAMPTSSAVDNTKLNMFTLVFYTNWNGSGTDRVIYSNTLLTSL